MSARGYTSIPTASSTTLPQTTVQQWRKKMTTIGIGFAAVLTGLASIYLYEKHRNQFLIASTAYTMLYTVFVLFVALRGKNPIAGDNTGWFSAVEIMSYLQCFNTFFVFLSVMNVVASGALERSRRVPRADYP